MKKLLLLIVFAVLSIVDIYAQSTAYRIYTRTALPLACSKTTSSTDMVSIYGTNLVYTCINPAAVYPANWGIVGGSISGSGANTRIAFWNGASSLSSDSAFTFSSNNLSIPAGGQFQINGTAFNFSNLAGNIAVSQMNSGTSASSSTFWRGDGTWAIPAVGISGSGVANRVALWSGTSSQTSDTGFTFTGTGATFDLTISRNVNATTFIGALTGIASGNELPLTFNSPLSRSVNTISCPTCVTTTVPFDDTLTIIKGSADATRLLRFEIDGFTSGSTRVITPPDANTNLPIYGATVTYTGITAPRTVTYPDQNFTILFSGGPLGTPSGGLLTNATGLPISTGVSGLASGAVTFLGSATSSNLRALLTDETGSGSAVFATSPSLVTPNLGAASATSINIGTGTTILKHLSTTAVLDFANLAAIGCEDLTVTLTGAALGDTVAIGVPNASIVTNGTFFGWVSATNTVSIKFCTVVSGDPASGTFRVDVWQH